MMWSMTTKGRRVKLGLPGLRRTDRGHRGTSSGVGWGRPPGSAGLPRAMGTMSDLAMAGGRGETGQGAGDWSGQWSAHRAAGVDLQGPGWTTFVLPTLSTV